LGCRAGPARLLGHVINSEGEVDEGAMPLTVCLDCPRRPATGAYRTWCAERIGSSSPTSGFEIVQTKVEIPVGKESGRHSHPGPEVGYIVQGDVDMVFDDRPTQHHAPATHF
jgi:hypothetical protein